MNNSAFRHVMIETLSDVICVIVSPTRTLMNWRRRNQPPKVVASMLRRWCRGFFLVSVLLCLGTLIFQRFLHPDTWISGGIRWIVLSLAWSRCNETMIAFARDARQWIEGRSYNPNLSSAHRLGFVIQSYAELWLLFALIVCHLPPDLYKPPLHDDILTSVYFSGTTISTLGYGEFLPVHWVSRFLVLYEVFSGLFLVVMAIAIYLSRAINPTAPDDETGFGDERDDAGRPADDGVDHI
jgi:hypothetical protein